MSDPGTTNTGAPAPEEKQCRICLDGEDPALGRLIRPCLCKGSISYVHVKCLQKWRTTSPSQSAFYACPQCHYKYAFVRTRALGIASNPLFVGMLSVFIFTILVVCCSFIATWFIDPDEIDSFSGGWSWFTGAYWVDPFGAAKDFIRIVVRFLQDEDVIMDRSVFSKSSTREYLRPIRPRGSRGFVVRFVQRFILGLPVVGAASLVHLLWTLSLLSPLHWMARWRTMNRGSRRERSRDLATIIVLIAIIGGVLRALWKVYRLTERWAERLLLRAEDVILEVNS